MSAFSKGFAEGFSYIRHFIPKKPGEKELNEIGICVGVVAASVVFACVVAGGIAIIAPGLDKIGF